MVGSCFRSKINELREQEHAIHNSYVSVKDWYELIQEARAVLYNKIQEVGMRYVSEDHYCYMDQEFEYHYMDSIINIPWVNYLDTVKMRSPAGNPGISILEGKDETNLQTGQDHAETHPSLLLRNE